MSLRQWLGLQNLSNARKVLRHNKGFFGLIYNIFR